MRCLLIILLAVMLTACQPALITEPLPSLPRITAPQPSRGTDRVLIFEATAYCYTGNQTATGTWAKEGRTVAVDPKIIPYGTKLEINGVSGYIAEDCGGDIKNNRIDIYMANYQDCVIFGRRAVEVRIIK